MSWSRRVCLLLGAVLLVGTGCGFQPLYGGGERNATVAELNRVEIGQIADRVGQELRNSLIDRMSTDPTGAPALYHLAVDINQGQSALAIQADDSITRYNLTMTANFTLSDLATGEAIYQTSIRAVGSYNVVDSDYATLVSQQDAEKRAAREISDQIATLISVFFSRRSDASR
jgi:LPS-assembly lipoprotein